MKIGFNEATTLKNSNLELDLQLCEQMGFDYIEIRVDKLKQYLMSHKLKDLVQFFDSKRLKPLAFNALESINFRTAETYRELRDELYYLCDIGTTIGCYTIVVVPSFDIGYYTLTEIKRESV